MMELTRQKVKDLQSAYAAANSLMDLRGKRPQGFRSKISEVRLIEEEAKDQPAPSFEPRPDMRKGKRLDVPKSRFAVAKPGALLVYKRVKFSYDNYLDFQIDTLQ